MCLWMFIPNADSNEAIIGGWECPKNGRYWLTRGIMLISWGDPNTNPLSLLFVKYMPHKGSSCNASQSV